MQRLPRILAAVAAALFVGFAALQWNDPDPALWIPVYLVPALICAAFAAGRLRTRVVPLAALAVATLWALALLPDAIHADPAAIVTDVHMYGPGVEEAREAMGLLIVALAMGAVAWRVPR